MILLWGSLSDGPMHEVMHLLQERNAPLLIIDQKNILQSAIELEYEDTMSAGIRYLDHFYDSKNIESAYIRTYDFTKSVNFKEGNTNNEAFVNAFKFEQQMTSMLEMHPGKIVNRVSTAFSNCSKPYQMDIIKGFGFNVPHTIITSSPDFAKQFLHQHKKIIYKSISSYRSIVSCLTAQDEDRLNDVACCPTQFQQCVEGTDYRVHVLGEKIFTTQIISSQSDYRYARDTQLIDFKLPSSVEEKCYELTRHLGLHFSGIDLRCTKENEWYCFEANPSPGYTYFSNGTGQKITEELTNFLMGMS